MPTALDLAEDDPALLDAVHRCRKLLNRRALIAAAASTVPAPGLDWVIKGALMSQLIPAINQAFGLTPKQIRDLPEVQREQVQKAIAVVGSLVIGRVVTRDLVTRMARTVGKRLTVQQAARYVPVAGQAVSAVLGYGAVRYLGEEHIKDCVRVARQAHLTLPLQSPSPPRRPAPFLRDRTSARRRP
jgi:uncharacterized protein (DUF697 family)